VDDELKGARITSAPLYVVSDAFNRMRERPEKFFMLFGMYAERVHDESVSLAVYAQDGFTRGTLNAAAEYLQQNHTVVRGSRFVIPVFSAAAAFDPMIDLGSVTASYPFLNHAAKRIFQDARPKEPPHPQAIWWHIYVWQPNDKKQIATMLQKVERTDVSNITSLTSQEIIAQRDNIEQLLSGTSR
jgi:hypothetical protein